jgi:hypothetical protein
LATAVLGLVVQKFAPSLGDRILLGMTTAVLQKLMRRESITTTMGYYVDLDADELAEDLYRNHGAGTVH